MPRRKIKRARKKRAVAAVKKPPKEAKKGHPLTGAVDFIVDNMGEVTRGYWSKQATKRSITLREIIIRYIVGDFELTGVDITKI